MWLHHGEHLYEMRLIVTLKHCSDYQFPIHNHESSQDLVVYPILWELSKGTSQLVSFLRADLTVRFQISCELVQCKCVMT